MNYSDSKWQADLLAYSKERSQQLDIVRAEIERRRDGISMASLNSTLTWWAMGDSGFELMGLSPELRVLEFDRFKKVELEKLDAVSLSQACFKCSRCNRVVQFFTMLPDGLDVDLAPLTCVDCDREIVRLEKEALKAKLERERLDKIEEQKKREEDLQRRVKAEHEERQQERLIKKFFEKNPSAKVKLSRIDNPPSPKHFKHIINWSPWPDEEDTVKGGLVLYGRPYCGKSTACYVLMYHLLEHHGWNSMTINADMLQTIPGLIRNGGYEEFISEAKHVNMLLFDDPFKFKPTPTIASFLFSVLEYRFTSFENRWPTFLTTNVKTKSNFIAQFTKCKGGDTDDWGLSIYCRLMEYCQWIDFDEQT